MPPFRVKPTEFNEKRYNTITFAAGNITREPRGELYFCFVVSFGSKETAEWLFVRLVQSWRSWCRSGHCSIRGDGVETY